jgi:hypothetical protein
MDTTASSSFSTRSNAKRAAEQMTAKGVAPAVDYGLERRVNGRFEIVWKTALTSAAFAETPGAQANQTYGDHMLEKAQGDGRPNTDASTDKVEAEIVTAGAAANEAAARSEPRSLAPVLSEPPPIAAQPEPEKNKRPDGTRVMVRTRKSWREAAIVSRLDPGYWRAQFPGGGSGIFKEADIKAYDAERDAKPATQPDRAKATEPKKPSLSRYAIDPEAIAAGRLPEKVPVVTSAANPHYQKHFDRLFGLAKAGDWDAVRDYKVTGSNSYSKMVARYREDLLALHAASETAQ